MSRRRAVIALLAFLFGVALVCGLSWIAGYNFDTRGADAIVTAMFSLLVGWSLAGAAIALTED